MNVIGSRRGTVQDSLGAVQQGAGQNTHLGCAVYRNVRTSRAEYQPQHSEAYHRSETVRPVPRVECLRDGHVGGSRHDAGHNTDYGDE
jgi:hypothetical protein